MAEFKKFSETEMIESMSDTASVLVEDKGEIKRIPAEKVGGGAGGTGDSFFKDGIIKQEALPEGYPYVVVTNGVLFDGEVTVEDNWTDRNDPISSIEPVIGETYTVVYNGDTYTLECKDAGGGARCIGSIGLWNDDSPYEGEPPFCYCEGWFAATEDGTHTVKITGVNKTIKKIDNQYINKEIAYTVSNEDVLPDDINDSPLWIRYDPVNSTASPRAGEVVYSEKWGGLALSVNPAMAAVNPLSRIEINSDEITQETFSITGLTTRTQYVLNVYDSATQRMHAADFGYIPAGNWVIPGTSTGANWIFEKVFYINGKRLYFVIRNVYIVDPEKTYTLTVTNLDAGPS